MTLDRREAQPVQETGCVAALRGQAGVALWWAGRRGIRARAADEARGAAEALRVAGPVVAYKHVLVERFATPARAGGRKSDCDLCSSCSRIRIYIYMPMFDRGEQPTGPSRA